MANTSSETEDIQQLRCLLGKYLFQSVQQSSHYTLDRILTYPLGWVLLLSDNWETILEEKFTFQSLQVISAMLFFISESTLSMALYHASDDERYCVDNQCARFKIPEPLFYSTLGTSFAFFIFALENSLSQIWGIGHRALVSLSLLQEIMNGIKIKISDLPSIRAIKDSHPNFNNISRSLRILRWRLFLAGSA